MGRIVPNKRPDFVLNLYQSLAKMYPYLKFIIQDPSRYNGEYANKLSIQLLELSDNNIQIVDPIHEQMPQILKDIDLLLVPSEQTDTFKEQYGRIVVEAKMGGCIVLVSESGALPEVVMNDELVVRSHNFNDWIERIKLLINLEQNEIKLISEKSTASALSYQTLKEQASLLASIL